RALVKYPLAMPISAGSWVMLARNPSRSVTGAEPEPEPDEPAADDEQPAPRRVTAATPAASSARLIKIRLSRSFYYLDQDSRIRLKHMGRPGASQRSFSLSGTAAGQGDASAGAIK